MHVVTSGGNEMRGDEREGDAGLRAAQDPAGWYQARDAVAALRDTLVAAGLARHFPYLRADVNAFGQGIVEIGRTTPDGATRIAELVALGLAVAPAAEVHGLASDADHGAGERGLS